MKVRRRGRRHAHGLAAVALSLVLTGCGSGSDDTGGPVAPETSTGTTPGNSPTGSATGDTSPSPSPDAEPSLEPSPSESTTPTATSTAGAPSTSSAPAESSAPVDSQARKSGLRGRLLGASDVPGFNDQFRWQHRSTRMREGRRPFATCHKFDMLSIGAMKVAVRRFAPARTSPGSSASHLVARFGDEMTARRAFEVLRAWRAQCDEELQRYDRSRVGRLQPVSVEGGASAGWYLLQYGPAGGPDSGYFDAQGLVRSGRMVAVLQMRLVGQDYNYRRGQEPMVRAVRNAAALL